MSVTDNLSTTGVWYFTDAMTAAQAAETAARIESLGYSTMWIPETAGRDPFAHIGYLATQTTTLNFATGIANIFHRHPGAMMQAANTLAEQTGGRFLLGMGVSHSPMVAGLRQLDYSKPIAQLQKYLEGMAMSPYQSMPPAELPKKVIGALGPKALAVSAEKADGAHPYWTTPEHTAEARAIMGPDKLLCVEQKLVLSTDAEAARNAGRTALSVYASLPNYRNNWLRLGFTDDDIDAKSDRLIDALVGWGDADALRARVQAHYDAGATHVCIQPVSTEGFTTLDWSLLEALAPANA